MSGAKPLPLPSQLPGENRALGGGLIVDLIPTSAGNLRNSMSEYKWSRLSRGVRLRAGWACEACGAESQDEKKHADTTCHERWVWDESSGWQRLTRLMALCVDCDAVTHLQHHREMRDGDDSELIEHLARVRDWSLTEAREHVRDREEERDQRSTVRWKMDRNLLVSTGLVSKEEAVEDEEELLLKIVGDEDDEDGDVWLTEEASGHRQLFVDLGPEVQTDLLFGPPEVRFFYVSYETNGRWVGVLLDPYWATDADDVSGLESKLIRHIAQERDLGEREVRLYSECLDSESAEDILLRAARR